MNTAMTFDNMEQIYGNIYACVTSHLILAYQHDLPVYSGGELIRDV